MKDVMLKADALKAELIVDVMRNLVQTRHYTTSEKKLAQIDSELELWAQRWADAHDALVKQLNPSNRIERKVS